MTSTHQRTDEIISAITAASGCSSSTVSALQDLLGLGATTDDRKRQTPPVKPAARRPARKNVLLSKQESSRRLGTDPVKILHEDSAPLCLETRLAFATQAINASLKALSEAVRQKQSNHPASGSPLKRPDATVRPAKKPLQPRSLNSPDKRNAPRQDCQNAVGHRVDQSGVAAVADCATTAMDFARRNKRDKGDGVDIQMENAALAFASKYIALGLDSYAARELRGVKRRLERTLVDDQGPTAVPEKESIPGLLVYQDPGSATECIASLIITQQYYVVKLICLRKKPREIEALTRHLDAAHQYSPLRLLQRVPSKSEARSKHLKQLESLSSTLFSMGPSLSTAADAVAIDPRQQPSPDMAFDLQVLALRTRLEVWKLSASPVMLEKDFWLPLSRFLGAFQRRSAAAGEQKFARAKAAFAGLVNLLNGAKINCNDELQVPSKWDGYRLMSSLAQEGGNFAEGMDYAKKASLLSLPALQSSVRKATITIRLATLMLHGRLENQLLEQIRAAHTCLISESLQGHSTDLDLLLLEVAGYRRALMNAFIRENEPETGKADLASLCGAGVFNCGRFLLRYLGNPPDEKDSEKARTRYSEKILKVRKAAPGFLDSVMYCAKVGVKSQSVDWDQLDTVLQDSLKLIHDLDTSNCLDGEPPISKSKIQIGVSTLYSGYFLQRSKSSVSPDSTAGHSIRRCVEVLEDADKATRTSGMLARRLEMLAEVCEKSHRFAEGYRHYQNALHEHIDSGLVESVAQQTSSVSFDAVWSSTNGLSLSRCIDGVQSLLWKVDLTEEDSLDFLDATHLEGECRGMILERQLWLFSNEVLKPSRRVDDCLKERLNRILRALFDLFDQERYPIRRRRVALQATYISLTGMDIIQDDIKRFVLEVSELPQKPEKSLDLKLIPYLDHLHACLRANLALSKTPSNIKDIASALATWQSICDSQPNDLATRIEGLPAFGQQLRLLADFLEVQCLFGLRISALSLLVRTVEAIDKEGTALTECLTALSLQCLRAGYSGQAGLILAKCQNVVDTLSPSLEAVVGHYLAYSEYFLCIGAAEKCELSLHTAEDLARQNSAFMNYMSGVERPSSIKSALRANSLLAHAYETFANFEFQSGRAASALRASKLCTRLLQRNWAILENSSSRSQSRTPTESPEGRNQASKRIVSQPIVKSMTHEVLNGSKFWSLVPALRRSYYLLSRIYSHHGFYQDAKGWMDLAEKIVDAVPSSAASLLHCSQMSDLHIRAGDVESGQRFLDQAVSMAGANSQPSLELAKHYASVAAMWRARVEPDDEVDALDDVISTVDQLMKMQENSALNQLFNFNVPPTKTAAKPSRRAISTKDKKKATPGVVAGGKTAGAECTPLWILRSSVLVDKSMALLRKGDLKAVKAVLDLVEESRIGNSSLVKHRLAIFYKLIDQATRAIGSDCTFNVLPESTISIPAISLELESDTSTSSATPAANKLRKPRGKAAKEVPDFRISIQEARDSLTDVHSHAFQMSSSSEYAEVCHGIAGASVFVSASTQASHKPLVHPTQLALLLDQPRIRAGQRTKAASAIASDTVSNSYKWPSSYEQNADLPLSTSTFEQDYIEIIPESWSAVSLNLNESKDELFLTRYRAGQSPFILRIPLTARNHALDHESLSFEEGKDELLDIIKQSRGTTSGARYIDSKAARAAWWAEREALDGRMRDLLINIENKWLGGFRGIFRRQPPQPLLVARFEKALQTALNRHLPSRRGRGKKSSVSLDPRILELFTSLDEGNIEFLDVEECVLDLLYFVVDVLQFNGECNAYDEIDFDSMVVEMVDAVKAYHSASIAAESSPSHHVILILDKNLHCIPWESLPTLKDVNISRLPSLEALRTRILSARATTGSDDIIGHRVGRSSGASLLNPSGDLKTTEEIIQPLLHSLPAGWSHSTSQPSEQELLTLLSSQDLYLYFGHGSGNQFVRHRPVRALPRCPTSWLMGCSSAAISLRGDHFEPEALLLACVDAGAPAVVGALWDVTDRDCDRASVRAGEAWGLWSGAEEGSGAARLLAKKGRQRKGDEAVEAGRGGAQGARGGREKGAVRGKGKGVVGDRERVSLVEAVRVGRDECYLKYLNGAAMVVYGIPVYLDG